MGLFEIIGFLYIIISHQVRRDLFQPSPYLIQCVIRQCDSCQLSKQKQESVLNSLHFILKNSSGKGI